MIPKLDQLDLGPDGEPQGPDTLDDYRHFFMALGCLIAIPLGLSGLGLLFWALHVILVYG